MTVTPGTAVPSSSPVSLWSARSDSADTSARTSCGARFAAQKISSGLVWVGVSGEIDVRNADALHTFACGHFRSSERLVLDLAEVDFFGAAGLRVFDELDEYTRRSGARWALVCGRSVQRLLRVADPGHRLRMHTSLESAMGSLRECA